MTKSEHEFILYLVNNQNIILDVFDTFWTMKPTKKTSISIIFRMDDNVEFIIKEEEQVALILFNKEEIKDFIDIFVTRYEKEYNQEVNKIKIEDQPLIEKSLLQLDEYLKTTSLETYENSDKDNGYVTILPKEGGFYYIKLEHYAKSKNNLQMIDCCFVFKNSIINYKKIYPSHTFKDFLLLKEKNMFQDGGALDEKILKNSTDSEFKSIVSHYFLTQKLDIKQKDQKIKKI